MSDMSSSTDSDLVDRSAASAAPGLRLDARQRAMLDEMGVKVWWPAPRRSPVAEAADRQAAGSPDNDAAAAHGTDAPSPTTQVADARVPDTPAATARPAAPAPRAPRATSASGSLATAPVPARGPGADPASASRGVPAVAFDAPLRLYVALDEDGIAPPPEGGWLVVADMPPEADGRDGEPFAGEAGRLLDNMLRALQLHDGRAPVHLMRTHRAAASTASASGRDTATPPAGTDFMALAAALAPRIVLALGPLAAQSLLRSTEPLGRLRGRAAPLRIAPDGPLDGLPVVVTYPPAYLLRNPADKARAWADLCLAAGRFDAPPA